VRLLLVAAKFPLGVAAKFPPCTAGPRSRAQRHPDGPATCLVHGSRRPARSNEQAIGRSHRGVRSTHTAAGFEQIPMPLPVQADAPGRRPNELRHRVSAERVRRLRPTRVRTNRPHVPSKELNRAPKRTRRRRCSPKPALCPNEPGRAVQRTRPWAATGRDAPTGHASERTQRPGSSNDPTHARPLRPRRRHARTRRRTRRGRSSYRSRQPASAGARSPARPATSRFSHPAARSGVAERRSSSGRCRWHGSRRCQPGGPRRRRVPSDRRSRPGSAPAGPRTWWP
jgi:hypothetical protein